ncbi:hypothetical protein CHS0354_004692 [Potamilus streckersoni]|uniref:Uncharacterized protein n=1 Tax=Potamilus streckersoni TaxID=2493646 RepID=A0AAE0SHR5_9BIVA|nr:hypothetical protein CHS0354_004692 [Potamilus streckersoni]
MNSTGSSGVATATRGEHKDSTKSTLYIGIGVVTGIAVIAIIIAIVLVCNRRRKRQRHGSSKRHLITTRGFSVLEHRRGQGHIDSTNEFEVYTNVQHPSRSSENSDSSPRTSVPKKPDRKRINSKSVGNNQYENVHLVRSDGSAVRKSASMDSNIPYIDRTLEKDLDDVFHPADKSAINDKQ